MFIRAIPQLEAGKMVAMGGFPGEELRKVVGSAGHTVVVGDPVQGEWAQDTSEKAFDAAYSGDGTEPAQKDTPTLGAVSYQSEYSALMLIRGKARQKHDRETDTYKFGHEAADARFACLYVNTDVFETVGVAQFIDGLWYVVVTTLGGDHFVVAGGYNTEKAAQEQINQAFNRYLLDASTD